MLKLAAANFSIVVNFMAKKELTSTSKLLIGLLAAGEALSLFFPTPRQFRKMALRGEWKSYDSFRGVLYRLYQRGWIKFVDKNNTRFIRLTKKGKLQALLSKMSMKPSLQWDGRWWLIMWDIPEESKSQRYHLRMAVRHMGFMQLQASVFISPYSVSREAMVYLNESGLINYIRIAEVKEMDNDKDLMRKFGLR